jgi:hypothetical protein
MKWVTRERPKIDRIACPWLVARFIDREPEFLYVPSSEVMAVVTETGAIPFDVPDVELGHVGELCSFDAFLQRYSLEDPALKQLAVIVRGADTGRPDLAPQAAGLLAISRGLSAVFADDHEMLRHGMVVYDALYAWCQSETHSRPSSVAEAAALRAKRKEQPMMRLISIFNAAVLAIGLASSAAVADQAHWRPVAEALGKTGAEMPGGVYRVGMPRTDLHVTLDGIELKPALALGSWVAFESMGDGAMVMGDLVLTEEEISPVMKKLAAGGIEITALHNHLLRARPATFYMHVLGHGEPVALARALHEALLLTKTPLGAAPAVSAAPQINLDTAMINRVLGAKGRIAGGVYQIGIPRAERVTDNGMAVPPAMGSAEAINFQPTGAGKAAITGDFVLTANEVNPVLRALRDHGIEVTALHNHMLDEQPRLFFMHFWANDDAEKLARGLRAALDKVNLAKS